MLKNDNIEITISYRNITHYRKLGYNPILNSNLMIRALDLPSSSHVKVSAICEICKSENNLSFHKYIVNKKRHGFYGCKSCSRQKAALTSLKLYGVDNYSKTDEYKKRVESTNIKKYGFKTNLISPDYVKNIKKILNDKYGTENFFDIRRKNKTNKRFKKIELDNILNQKFELSESKYQQFNVEKDYLLYRNECRRITNRHIRKLFENWNGTDYYDGENIVLNFDLPHNHTDYPTIDHKVSIYYGFINKISPNEIGDISNLCVTKRSINSSKRDKIF